MISPVRPSTTSPVRPAKSTNSFSPMIWVWRIVGFSRPAQPRYRSQNQGHHAHFYWLSNARAHAREGASVNLADKLAYGIQEVRRAPGRQARVRDPGGPPGA